MCRMSSRCVCRTSRVCSDSQPMTCAQEANAPGTLRRLLLGEPIMTRDARTQALLALDLNAVLEGIVNFVRAKLATLAGEVFDQLALEWSRVIALPATYAGLVAKRGAVLFAFSRDPHLMELWRATDGPLIDTLREWVLPMAVPPFVKGMGQRPAQLGALVAVLVELWGDDPPGCGARSTIHIPLGPFVHEPAPALCPHADSTAGRQF